MGIFQKERLLPILLAAFFLKGVFLATLFPMFTGQDEARHYNSVQFLNEPADKNWEKSGGYAKTGNDLFSDYNFSEEILESGQRSGIDRVRSGLENTAHFSDGPIGENEPEILEKPWHPYNLHEYPDAIRKSLYHTLAASIERALEEKDILTRFYAIRVFSVFLGMLGVLFAFLLARTIGFAPFESILIAALVAFQPKYAMYTTNINYDALLIPLFFLFAWGGARSLRDGLAPSNLFIMILAATLAALVKGTGIILVAIFLGLLGFHALTFFKANFSLRKRLLSLALLCLVVFAGLSILNTRYPLADFIPFDGSPAKISTSIADYLDKSLTLGRFALSSRTYWGSLGWDEGFLTRNFTDIVWRIEWIAAIGLILFFCSKKTLAFLPERKYVWFLVALVVTLQLGIRFADWTVFSALGSLDLGTPGRYFLPTLPAHLALIAIGLGRLLPTRDAFRNLLVFFVILMVFFSLSLTYGVILPRFYF